MPWIRAVDWKNLRLDTGACDFGFSDNVHGPGLGAWRRCYGSFTGARHSGENRYRGWCTNNGASSGHYIQLSVRELKSIFQKGETRIFLPTIGTVVGGAVLVVVAVM